MFAFVTLDHRLFITLTGSGSKLAIVDTQQKTVVNKVWYLFLRPISYFSLGVGFQFKIDYDVVNLAFDSTAGVLYVLLMWNHGDTLLGSRLAAVNLTTGAIAKNITDIKGVSTFHKEEWLRN